MTHDSTVAPLVDVLLLELRRRGPIIASDAEAGIRRLADREGSGATHDAWRAAVTAALAAGYVHDPVVLPQGALQCHWRLELAAPGFEAVRHAADQGVR